MNEELIARAIARGHFMRKRHYGACTQEEAVVYQVENGWRNFLPDALYVIDALRIIAKLKSEEV